MSRLTIRTVDNAPEASLARMQKSIANNGFLPNLIGVLSNAPAALETYVTVGEINSRTSLTLAEREVVQLTAARIHGCDFCLAGHAAVAMKKAGQPAEAVRALQSGGITGDEKLDAVAAFTQAVIASRGAVGDDDYAAFLSHGYHEQQALEVVLGVSLATLCNFANSLAGTPVNEQMTRFLPGAF